MEDEVAAVVVDNGSGMVKVRDLTMMRPDLRDPALFFSYAIARFFSPSLAICTGRIRRRLDPGSEPNWLDADLPQFKLPFCRPVSPEMMLLVPSSPRSSDALVIKV